VAGDGGSLGATGRGGKGKIDRDSIRQLKSDGNQAVLYNKGTLYFRIHGCVILHCGVSVIH
jgi:hypothetical protein